MKIYIHRGPPIELDIEPDELWVLYKANQRGLASVHLKIPHRGKTFLLEIDMIEAEMTFRTAIIENHPSVLPPSSGTPSQLGDTMPSPDSTDLPPSGNKPKKRRR